MFYIFWMKFYSISQTKQKNAQRNKIQLTPLHRVKKKTNARSHGHFTAVFQSSISIRWSLFLPTIFNWENVDWTWNASDTHFSSISIYSTFRISLVKFIYFNSQHLIESTSFVNSTHFEIREMCFTISKRKKILIKFKWFNLFETHRFKFQTDTKLNVLLVATVRSKYFMIHSKIKMY